MSKRVNMSITKKTDTLQRSSSFIVAVVLPGSANILATALNNAGWVMIKTLWKQVEIPWGPGTIKEFLWRPIQQAVAQQSSTTDLKTAQGSEVYEILNRHTADKLGVHVPCPDQSQRIIDKEYRGKAA